MERTLRDLRMDNSEAVRRTSHLYDELNRIILEWDPYGLSRQGEIADEFSSEVWQLLTRLPEITTEDQTIAALQEIFRGLFPELGWSIIECQATGRRIFQWWRGAECGG